MPVVRWGLLSTAHINRRLIPNFKSSKRGQLRAVASRNLPQAQSYAQEWQIPLAFGSYAEMLESDEIDAVYIGLPNHLHAEWTIRALQAGKHVLCEKPFAISLAEVDAMISASQANQRVLAEALMYRHHPQTKLVGDWVRSGKLGEILLVRGVFHYKLTQTDNVRLVPEYGGGSLWDVGIYPLSFAQHVYNGPPVELNALQWLGPTGIDLAFQGQMRYSFGGAAQISSSFLTPDQTQVEIIGSEGRLFVPGPFRPITPELPMVYYPKQGEPFEIPVPATELFAGEISDMHDAILDGKPTHISLTESRHHVQTILALYEAARQEKTLKL
ncbi:MAG: Gfo/Idh/MocA family oxidoreductase [Anaerolineales bacterium]|nr:Gfo/Idh/MocA family oxidoreductase [Anaerolineales bacterium]